MQKPAYVIFDLETSGLDPEYESVLEVGAIAVDQDLRTLSTFEVVVAPVFSHHTLRMDPIVQKMHADNGLLDDLNKGRRMLYRERADAVFFEWLKRLGYGEKEVVIAGHTIDFDYGFARKHLPQSFALFSHRKFDFSATTRFFRDPPFNYPILKEEMPHRALADAELELRELRSMRDLILSDRQFRVLRANG